MAGWLRALARALHVTLAAIVAPPRLALEELLGGQRTEPVVAPPAAPATMAALIRRPPIGERVTAFLIANRRSATFGACLLLIGAAALAGMPVASAAPGEAPSPSPIAAAETMAPDAAETADPSAQPAGAEGDAGDGSILNVIQAADVGSVGAGFRVYVVKGGDTLYKIGAQFGLTRNTVYWANTARLPNPASLRVGQRLVIPPANGITVTVKDGDTLSGLGSRYEISVTAIQAANGLGDTNLNIGQLLLIPVTPPSIPAPQATPCSGCNGWTGARLRWPVPFSHTITQYFGRTHPALDIGANSGSHVIAAVGGKVIWSGWKNSGPGSGGGIEIWINSGGKLWTTYNHLSHSYVRVGQTVRAGQHIGNVGMTGNATGPHLHFETWICYPWTGGGAACARDPLSFM